MFTVTFIPIMPFFRAQTFQVQLPSNFTCENCTIRLIRQALEWGANYKFWSCADVDVKPSKSTKYQ